MSNCLNCGKELNHTEGKRPRKFCDNKNKCKQKFHNKQKKQPKYVQFKSFQELKAKFEAVVKENTELKSLLKKNGAITNVEFDKAVIPIKIPSNNNKSTEPLSDWERKNIETRISDLEKELKNPEKNPFIGKRNWIKIREDELQNLKIKL